MKMTTKMIMLQNIEKMVMEQQRVDENDSYIRQDNEDLKYLEERYDQLQLSHTVKRVIDDYIAQPDIANQGTIIEFFRLYPKILTRLLPFTFGVSNNSCYQF